jgi:CRISPR-associated exonuclease Cas4
MASAFDIPGPLAEARETHLFRVTDLKQYAYCPRILFYQTILPQVRPITYKMQAGIAAHEEAGELERRRTLRTYGLSTGQRHFNVSFHDVGLGLSGEVDMLIETDVELIPVDYKYSAREGEHYRLQLMAYGRLLELNRATSRQPVKRGFLYLIPRRQAVEIPFTPALRRRLADALDSMQHIARTQQIPVPTGQRRRCVDCEFRRFCNDVL